MQIVFLFVLIVSPISAFSETAFHFDTKGERVVFPPSDLVSQALGQGMNEREKIASQLVAEQFGRQISSIEWLAPLAPVALSPFFGITLLSGLANYGPEWLPDNALLNEGSPMSNPVLFWVFLVLTLLTSIPRFSKVSKPLAQLADFLETYSAIVILVVLKMISIQAEPATPVALAVGDQAGILAMGWEGFLALAMAVNIFVINAVKSFFEILVWITPIPFLDACFEVANKSMCGGLMVIYAFSPVAAFVVNILLFLCCALVFVWIRRREIFFRTMLLDWLMAKFSRSKKAVPDKLVVFPRTNIGGIPARSKCLLLNEESGWTLISHRLLRGPVAEQITGELTIRRGWWMNSIDLGENRQLSFSSRFNDQLEELAGRFDMKVIEDAQKMDKDTSRQLEFA